MKTLFNALVSLGLLGLLGCGVVAYIQGYVELAKKFLVVFFCFALTVIGMMWISR